MNTVLDRFISGEMSISEIISLDLSESDLQDILAFVDDDRCRASALYILSEIPSNKSQSIWKYMVRYVDDANEEVAFYALDIMHTFIFEAKPADLMFALRSANLNSPMVFKKLFAIVLSATHSLLGEVSLLAQEQGVLAEHCWGLRLLLEEKTASEREIAETLRGDNLVKRFYGCCAVGRSYHDNLKLLAMLPKPIQRRLAIYRSADVKGS